MAKQGKDRGNSSYSPVFLCGLLWFAGCTAGGQRVDEAMRADGELAARSTRAAAGYQVGCPDVLEVRIEGRTEPGGRRPVGPDGRIDLGPLGLLRVEGQTTLQIAREIAARAGVPPEWVRVRVAEYNSQQVYLFGAVTGLQRAVPYQGEETVADLLQRTGGITAGAAPAQVHLIRPRVVEGRAPLIYHVDLQAIVLDRDLSTNLRVQPFDQIYVAQTRKSSLEKCVPPVLRPIYQVICGLQCPSANRAPR
ncbi:MAG TPA: polysaccharide biosynthesis/export family protein [Gemmataceae bacterium]|jgi:protein involved in polysaccharide export with SLBB domain|nr:polysaccharide biosynthesis/export family protein [Gemmataceae bacterium]